MKTGIIFDMDGTLWNSAREVAASWSLVTEKKLGRSVSEEDMYRVMGMPMDRLVATLFPEYPLEKLLPVMAECGSVENEYLRTHGARLYPKLEETLKILSRDYPLYIVSNCQTGYIEAFLEHYDFGGYFSDFICYGTNEKQKSENIAIIIERNALTHGIYVGDIQADYEAAVAGGASFIHAAYGFGTIEDDVPAISSFSQLPQLLKEQL